MRTVTAMVVGSRVAALAVAFLFACIGGRVNPGAGEHAVDREEPRSTTGARRSDKSPPPGAADAVASQPSNAVTPGEGASVIADVTFHPQERPLTCEEAALRMALAHQGIVVSEATLLDDIGVDARPSYVDPSGTLHWGNPYTSAVGDPDGSESALTGYGTYYTTIAREAQRLGATVLEAGENIAPADLYTALLMGHPAVVWVANDWDYHPPVMPWVTFDGRQLWWHGPVEHAVTLVGVTESTVIVDNPALPMEWQSVPKPVFERAYGTFGEMAVILQ